MIHAYRTRDGDARAGDARARERAARSRLRGARRRQRHAGPGRHDVDDPGRRVAVPGERYVALGLAHVRSAWFRDVARWATSAAIPRRVREVRVGRGAAGPAGVGPGVLRGARRRSLPGVDRDLVDLAQRKRLRGADRRRPSHRSRLGRARRVGRPARRVRAHRAARDARRPRFDDRARRRRRRRRRTTKLGQRLAGPARRRHRRGRHRRVARRHGARAGPGRRRALRRPRPAGRPRARTPTRRCSTTPATSCPACRSWSRRTAAAGRRPTRCGAITFDVVERRYHLLLGLRRHRDWTALRPRAFEAALDACAAATASSSPTSTPTSRARTSAGRSTSRSATSWPARSSPGPTRGGRRAAAHEGPARARARSSTTSSSRRRPHRIVAVVNRAPRSPRARAELTHTLAELTTPITRRAKAPPPLFLPDRKRLDDAIRDGARLPGIVRRRGRRRRCRPSLDRRRRMPDVDRGT